MIGPEELESTDEGWVQIAEGGNTMDDPIGVPSAPESGSTRAVPRLANDLRALLKLSKGTIPMPRVVRGKVVITAYYSFGDASSGGFGASVEREEGIHGRFGL